MKLFYYKLFEWFLLKYVWIGPKFKGFWLIYNRYIFIRNLRIEKKRIYFPSSFYTVALLDTLLQNLFVYFFIKSFLCVPEKNLKFKNKLKNKNFILLKCLLYCSLIVLRYLIQNFNSFLYDLFFFFFELVTEFYSKMTSEEIYKFWLYLPKLSHT